VEDHLNRTLTLWVYNSEFDVVREVQLVPRRGWGGEGALGAVLGYGALHRLPVGLGEEVEGPGEVVFESKEDGFSSEQSGPGPSVPTTTGGNFLVPANMTSPPPLSAVAAPSTGKPAAARSGRKHRHAALSPNRAFDEYFAEGERKSQEQDYAPSRRGTPVPPPPKGGPPSRFASPAPTATSSEPAA